MSTIVGDCQRTAISEALHRRPALSSCHKVQPTSHVQSPPPHAHFFSKAPPSQLIRTSASVSSQCSVDRHHSPERQVAFSACSALHLHAPAIRKGTGGMRAIGERTCEGPGRSQDRKFKQNDTQVNVTPSHCLTPTSTIKSLQASVAAYDTPAPPGRVLGSSGVV